LYIFVPQTGQEPLVAGLPFFIVTAWASFISRWVRHFRQYACIDLLLSGASEVNAYTANRFVVSQTRLIMIRFDSPVKA
jgi:hypothetical protein